MNENNVIATRVNDELFEWLNNKATDKKCKVSDLIREAILVYQELASIPEEMRFSKLLHIQGAKASMLTYRLLQLFISEPNSNGAEIIKQAQQMVKSEYETYKINT